MSVAVRRGLYGKLAGDTTLNTLLATPPSGWAKSIYHQQAPQGATYPFVVFQKQAGTPTYTFKEGKAGFENDVWLVKAVGKGSTADPAEAAADRLVALLTDAELSISGANHLYLRRQSDVDYPEVTDGVPYQHVGSLWRLVTEPT